jgi:hypothetical protein
MSTSILGVGYINISCKIPNGKEPSNTYHLNPKWAGTLPLGIVQEIFIDPNQIS